MEETIVRYPNPLAALPDASFEWLDGTGALLALATGYTFSLTISRTYTSPIVLTKTAGIAGFNTSPNLQVSWAAPAGLSELSILTAGRWIMEVKAVHTATLRPRFLVAVLDFDHNAPA